MKGLTFNDLYKFATKQGMFSTDFPIKVNGKIVVDVKLNDKFELELITKKHETE